MLRNGGTDVRVPINYFLEPIREEAGSPRLDTARHGSTSEKHYLCDQLPSATRGAGVDTDGLKFERRGLTVQIGLRRAPKPYLNGFQKLSIVKSRLTARPRRSNRAQAIAYLRFERRDFNLDPNK